MFYELVKWFNKILCVYIELIKVGKYEDNFNFFRSLDELIIMFVVC